MLAAAADLELITSTLKPSKVLAELKKVIRGLYANAERFEGQAYEQCPRPAAGPFRCTLPVGHAGPHKVDAGRRQIAGMVAEMRSAVTLSTQFRTPVIDRQGVSDWADALEGFINANDETNG